MIDSEKKLSEKERFDLEVLMNLKRESSNDVWSTLSNTNDKVLVAYILDRVGEENVIKIINSLKD